ncbi:hypothetical protein HDZ31DRAFT_9290, partial [Schizophyllum fasciatum]
YTCNENNKDVRRMVISRGMIDQKPNMFEDSLGHSYLQFPSYHGLSYVTTPTNIYNSCKSSGVGFYGDRCITIMKWFERLEAATGIRRGYGLHESQLPSGRVVYFMVVASSDQPDNVPRPAARIQRFKEFLNTDKEPVVRQFVQPRVSHPHLYSVVYSFLCLDVLVRTRVGSRHEPPQLYAIQLSASSFLTDDRLAADVTYDENCEDPRCMVISPGMIGQKPDTFRDSLGRTYFRLPDCHALAYITTTSSIYKSCKKSGVGFYGDRSITILKWFDRLEAATGVSRGGSGVQECQLKDGRLAYILIVALSDNPDTVPHPAARIQKFKDILRTKNEPKVRHLVQPRV